MQTSMTVQGGSIVIPGGSTQKVAPWEKKSERKVQAQAQIQGPGQQAPPFSPRHNLQLPGLWKALPSPKAYLLNVGCMQSTIFQSEFVCPLTTVAHFSILDGEVTTLIMLMVYTNFLLKAIASYAKWVFLPRAKLLMLLKKNDFYKIEMVKISNKSKNL